MTRRWMTLFGALAAIAIGASLAIALSMRARAEPPSPTVTLQTASTEKLAGFHLRLSQPVGPVKIDKTAASNAAIAEHPGWIVREAVLAQVDETDSAEPSSIHCLCWVVSIAPPDGLPFPSSRPSGAPETTSEPTYLLWIIDANTGRFVEGVMGE